MNVLDPLYPAKNPTWGHAPAPNARLTVAQLGRDFVKRRTSTANAAGATSTQRNRTLGGPFVIVMPVQAVAVPAKALLAG